MENKQTTFLERLQTEASELLEKASKLREFLALPNAEEKVNKLTKIEVEEIKQLLPIMQQKEIAKIYNVHNSTISNINKNITHGTRN